MIPRTVFRQSAGRWEVNSAKFTAHLMKTPAAQHGRAIKQARTWCVRVNQKIKLENQE